MQITICHDTFIFIIQNRYNKFLEFHSQGRLITLEQESTIIYISFGDSSCGNRREKILHDPAPEDDPDTLERTLCVTPADSMLGPPDARGSSQPALSPVVRQDGSSRMPSRSAAAGGGPGATGKRGLLDSGCQRRFPSSPDPGPWTRAQGRGPSCSQSDVCSACSHFPK